MSAKTSAVLFVLAVLAAVAPFAGSYVLVLMTQALVLGIIAMSEIGRAHV